ncbi:SUKH-4 family immunity protein [Plantactinospora sp. GCM10030261]|uniref:SUKH-4 family immunity protein n=1 Tax=Plantactinospora sp. GCM10030261 TaxID=3273420 RepID=UPI003607049A
MSVNHDEVVAMWGSSQVRVFPLEHLEGLGVPTDAHRLLGEVGLPTEAGFLFAAAPLTATTLPGLGPAVAFGSGWNGEYDICVRGADARIYASHRAEREVTLVNTRADFFIEFLLRAAGLHQLYDGAEEGLVDQRVYLDTVDETLGGLRSLDPEALVDGAWWTGVLDDFKLV